MTWIRRQYCPKGGFNERDIQTGYYSLYIDLECSVCGFTVSLAHANGNEEKECPQCLYLKT